MEDEVPPEPGVAAELGRTIKELRSIVSDVDWSRMLLTGALYACTFAAVVIAIPPAGLLFIVIGAFGRDNPNTTVLQYLAWLAIPPSAFLLMGLAAWFALWLWRKPRGQYASFPIAIGLLACSIAVSVKLMPHR